MSAEIPANRAATPADPAQIRAEIEQTRSDLAGTVEALAAKLDVKAQIGSAVSNAKGRVMDRANRATSAVTGSADRVRGRVSRQLSPGRPSVVRESLPFDETRPAQPPSVYDEARRRRTQAITTAGVACLALLAVALWALRRRRLYR